MLRALGLILFVVLQCVLQCPVANAQTIFGLGPVETSGRTATLPFYAFEANGSPVDLNPSDVALRVDGQPLTFTVEKDDQTTERTISVAVLVDVSSEASAPDTRSLLRAGVDAVPTAVRTTADLLALTQFDSSPTMLLGFDASATNYTEAASEITSGSGFDLQRALMEPTMGGLRMMQTVPRHRVLLVLTSSTTAIDLDATLALARTFQIAVYVGCTDGNVESSVRRLCEGSGGTWADSLSTTDAMTGFVLAAISHAKTLPSQRIVVDLPTLCSPSVPVAITIGSTTRTAAVSVDPLARSSFEWFPEGLDFGTGANEQILEATVVARGPEPLTIEVARLSSPSYTILNPVIGVETILPGSSRTFRIQRTANPDGTFAQLDLTATTSSGVPICAGLTYAMRGGLPTTGDRFTVVAPNGGEVLTAGEPTTIRWTNSLPQTKVRIDLSTNGGDSWRPVAEQAQGLEYSWIPGPELTTDARIRIQETVLPDTSIITLRGHQSPVYATVFANEGRWVITGGHDGTIRVWDANTGEFLQQLGSHGSWVWDLAVSPDGRFVASAGHDGVVSIWNLATGVRLRSILADARVWSVAYSPSGTEVAIGTERSLSVVDVATGRTIDSHSTGASRCLSVAYTSDGAGIVSAEGSVVRLRERSSLSVVRTTFTGHDADVYAVVVDDATTRVYTGSADFTIAQWDATTGARTHVTTPSIASILNLDLSADQQTLASAGGDGTVKLWSATDLTLRSSFADHVGSVYCATFNADGTRIASGATDSKAFVWNVASVVTTEDVSDGRWSIVGGTVATADANHGSVRLGAGSDITTSMISNTGTEDLVLRSIRVVSGDVQDFQVMVPTLPLRLQAGMSLRLRSACAPSTVGPRSALVDIETGVGSATAVIRAEGVASPLLTTPLNRIIDVGRLLVGQTQADTTIRFTVPSGGSTVEVTRVVLAGVQRGAFTITSGGTPFTLTPGAVHTMSVRCAPTQVGRYAARIELTLADGSTTTIRLYGEGLGDGRIATTTNTLLYQTDPCARQTTVQTATILNQGTAPLTVYSIGVVGPRAVDFAVTSPQPSALPLQIAPGDQIGVSVAFQPLGVGSSISRLVISSNGIGVAGSTLEIPLIARQDSVGFELTVPHVHFDNVQAQQQAAQTATIVNTGTTSLQWPPQGIDLGDFRLENIEPTITPAGGTSNFTIRFKGGEPRTNPYTASYTFTDSICGRQQELTMSATVKSYIGATVAADIVRASIGQEVDVPVRLLNKVNFDRTTITTLNARIRVNGTILTPLGIESTFDNGERIFTTTLPIPTSGDLLGTLRFRTSWGNDTSSVVEIDSLWAADTVVLTGTDGEVILDNLCREGGPRLFLRRSAQQGIGVDIIPHPVVDAATAVITVVEHGPTLVQVVNVHGRVVTTLADAVLAPGRYLLPLDAADLETGSYTVVMTTQTQKLSNRCTVVR